MNRTLTLTLGLAAAASAFAANPINPASLKAGETGAVLLYEDFEGAKGNNDYTWFPEGWDRESKGEVVL